MGVHLSQAATGNNAWGLTQLCQSSMSGFFFSANLDPQQRLAVV